MFCSDCSRNVQRSWLFNFRSTQKDKELAGNQVALIDTLHEGRHLLHPAVQHLVWRGPRAAVTPCLIHHLPVQRTCMALSLANHCARWDL